MLIYLQWRQSLTQYVTEGPPRHSCLPLEELPNLFASLLTHFDICFHFEGPYALLLVLGHGFVNALNNQLPYNQMQMQSTPHHVD